MISLPGFTKKQSYMKVKIEASVPEGILSAPPSKSAMQRAVAGALLAHGTTELINPSYCNDALASINMAGRLGAGFKKEPGRLIIKGGYNPLHKSLNSGESGLGVRLFSAIAALHNDWIEINGSGSLINRPLHMIPQTLETMGVEIKSAGGYLPLKIKGPIKPGISFVDGSLSSQFLTGLLMALPVLDSDSKIIVRDLKSKPYIDLTIKILSQYGISVNNMDYSVFRVPGKQVYQPGSIKIESDWSGTAFLLVLGAVAGDITVRDISVDSYQSDRHIINILREAGASMEILANEIRVRKSALKAFETDISDCPDLAPPLSVLASFCKGKSIIHGTERLKVKESNRGKVLMSELSKLGVKIRNLQDRIEVEGPSVINGGYVDSYDDHRISMALAVMAVAASGEVVINRAESVNKSYPSFFSDLKRTGIKLIISE